LRVQGLSSGATRAIGCLATHLTVRFATRNALTIANATSRRASMSLVVVAADEGDVVCPQILSLLSIVRVSDCARSCVLIGEDGCECNKVQSATNCNVCGYQL